MSLHPLQMLRRILRMKYQSPVRGIYDGLSIGRDDAWAWFQLGSFWRAYKTRGPVVDAFLGMLRAFSSLSAREFHILIVPRPFEPEEWVKRRIAMNPTSRRWRQRNEKLGQVLEELPNWRYDRYLGIPLGERPTYWQQFTGYIRGWFRRLERHWSGLEDPVVKPAEVAKWQTVIAESVAKKVENTALQGVSATARDIRWLTGFTAQPGRRVRPTQGQSFAGVSLLPLYNFTTHNPVQGTHLVLEGETTTYVSTGVVTELPPKLYSPGPRGEWLDLRGLPVPVIVSIRGSHDPKTTEKYVKRRKKQAARQVAQDQKVKGEADPLWERDEEKLRQLDANVRGGEAELVPTSFCVKVWANSEAELHRRRDIVKKHFDRLGIRVEFPMGNQLALHLESQPGERSLPYYQLETEPPYIVASGLLNQYGVGDDDILAPSSREGLTAGHYIGLNGSVPTFFAPGNAGADRVKTGTLYVGEPGMGKSALLKLLLIWEHWLQQAGIVILDLGYAREWDRVVEFLNRDNANWAQDEGWAQDAGPRAQVRSYDPADKQNWGRLDPFLLITESEEAVEAATEAAMDVMMRLVNMNREEKNLASEACDAVVSAGKPCLSLVFNHLAKHSSKQARELARSLHLANKGIARLFVGSPDQEIQTQPLFDPGSLTVIHILGLQLPEPGKLPGDYSVPEKLSAFALEMIEHELRRQLRRTQGYRRILAYTEGWFILRQTNSMVSELARTGSKLDVEIHLDTQYTAELMGSQELLNAFSTIFGFNAGVISRDLAELLGIPAFADEIATANRYTAVVRDRSGRLGHVAFDLVFNEIAEATHTKAKRSTPVADEAPDDVEWPAEGPRPAISLSVHHNGTPAQEVLSGPPA